MSSLVFKKFKNLNKLIVHPKPFLIINNKYNQFCIVKKDVNFLTKPNLSEIILTQKRFKKKTSKKQQDSDSEEDSDEEDSDSDNEDNKFKDQSLKENESIKKYDTKSLRLDSIIKTALGCTHQDVIDMINNDKCRINGERSFKKSQEICEGQIIDLIHSYSENDLEKLIITRLEVLEIDQKQLKGRRNFYLKKTKSLVVDNYPDSKYEKF